MEADLLKSLSFEIGGPTVTTFLRYVFSIKFSVLRTSIAFDITSLCSMSNVTIVIMPYWTLKSSESNAR